MNEKALNIRQICFLFAAVLPVTRMLVYPATLSFHAKNDLVLSAFISFAAEFAVISLLLLLAKKTDLTFFELLQNTFGKSIARAVYFLFSLYFLFSALLPVLEQRGFILQVFYENVPSFLSFIPFVAVCLYACTKGLRSIGRVADLSMPVFAVCIPVLLLLAVPEADFTALLPVGATGAGNIFRSAAESMNWFSGAAYMLLFLGNFRYEKKSAVKILSAYAIGAAIVLFFLAVFYGIFSDISILQQNALAHVSKYATAFTSLGRIDLLFVFALSLVLLFALCIPLQLSTHCAAQAFSIKPAFPAAAISVLVLLFILLFNQAYLEIQTLMTQKLWYVFAFFALLLPALALLLRKKEREKPNIAVNSGKKE